MKKYLAWLGIIVLVSIFVTCEKEKYAHDSPSPPADGRSSTVAAGDKVNPASNSKEAQGYSPRWEVAVIYRVFSWPEGVTVWALFLTLITIAEQTSQTRKAAEAGESAAEAARLNAQAVVDAGRARILFEVQKELDTEMRGVGIFTIFAVNYGTVPAEVLSYGQQTEFCETPTNLLPLPPNYPPPISPPMRYLIPQSRHPIAKVSPAMPGGSYRLLASIPGPPSAINDIHRLVYGEVVYNVGFSTEAKHSRYCFRFNRQPFSNIGGSLEQYGPSEYNECT